MPRGKRAEIIPLPAPPRRARIYVPLATPGLDDETRALVVSLNALLKLSKPAQIRVLVYLRRRLGIGFSECQ